ncbi:MAG: 30S ribosomal protein S21 [Microscillaceae bacterium]|nr:30S ribosomal protein S21 [Microscillaceae bacterium]MDW8459799.1 30S ribosomal protein S21 [Cytophagales bacterium]
MIAVNVKPGEPIDKALKRLKKKFERTGILKEIRNKSFFEKKSVKRRNVILRAAYRERMRRQESNGM